MRLIFNYEDLCSSVWAEEEQSHSGPTCCVCLAWGALCTSPWLWQKRLDNFPGELNALKAQCVGVRENKGGDQVTNRTGLLLWTTGWVLSEWWREPHQPSRRETVDINIFFFKLHCHQRNATSTFSSGSSSSLFLIIHTHWSDTDCSRGVQRWQQPLQFIPSLCVRHHYLITYCE